MYNDSIETLLLRHYGRNAQTPPTLEQRLVASVQGEAQKQYQQQHMASHLRAYRVSRRDIVKLVALGSTGLGLLSASLQSLETTIAGQDAAQSVLP